MSDRERENERESETEIETEITIRPQFRAVETSRNVRVTD